MKRSRISETLVAIDGKITCGDCCHVLASIGMSWKSHAALTNVGLADLPSPGTGVDKQVTLRRFSCPACGKLLDTETAMPDDPYLEDIVRV
ncbi:MAG: acetone carboxylase subunit gamma [Sterolibacterium sp.]